MAYTNAIFFLDYDNGNDAARTTLSSVVFSNPSSTTVLGTKVGHGLVTGAVITVSGCTQAYANTAWKITKVNDDTFTLDTALWDSFNGADVTGDVVPFGGQSWADAWKTISSGATAARIAPGDIVKIAKSPAPTLLAGATGHATWTNLSKTVTLADAQTANITLCEADWTAVNATSAAKLAVATDAKEGSYCVKIVEDGTPAADEVQAYFATGDLTLSGYQKISFWIKNEVAILANQLELNLCSNADGTGDVDVFPIPAIPSAGTWVPLTIARNSGGNLGSSTIKSINISNGSNATTYTASKYVYLDNILACTTSGLNLQSLISKNSHEQSTTTYNDGWYAIQSINGTTVLIDSQGKANAGRGYYTAGTSPDTVDTYYRETTKYAMVAASGTAIEVANDSGTFGNNIQFLGGYNTTDATGATCDGETFIDPLNGMGLNFNLGSRTFLTVKHISCVRGYQSLQLNGAKFCTLEITDLVDNRYCGLYMSNSACMNDITVLNINNNLSTGIYSQNHNNFNKITVYHLNNCTNDNVTFENVHFNYLHAFECCNCGSYGISSTNGSTMNTVKGDLMASNAFTDAYVDKATIYFVDTPMNSSTEASTGSSYLNSRVYSNNHDGNVGSAAIYTDYGLITTDTTNRNTASGVCWKMAVTGADRSTAYPLELSIAKIACAASAAVTVTAYVKKTHATDIAARLLCKGGQIAGVASDVEDVKASDTDYENLSITFTPSAAGVVEIVVQAWWVANTADESVYVDDVTISQA